MGHRGDSCVEPPEATPLASTAQAALVWIPSLAERIARFLPRNVVACTIRLVDKACAKQFRSSCSVVRLSEAAPPEEFARKWSAPCAMDGLSRAQRLQLLCLTAASGSIPNLKVAIDSSGLLHLQPVLEAAAAADQLHICEWMLLHRHCRADEAVNLMAVAAKAGKDDICRWLLSQGFEVDMAAIYAAAHGGHVELLQQLLHHGLSTDVSAGVDAGLLLGAVAEACGLSTLRHLHTTQLQGRPESQQLLASMLAGAAASRTDDWQEKVLWLESRGCRPSARACTSAATCPDAFARLLWLCHRGYPADEGALREAARTDNEPALAYLLGQMIFPSHTTAEAAAECGHVSVIQTLIAAGCVVAPSALEVAARNGHLAVVEYLVEILGDTALTETLFEAAGASGCIKLMAWLLQQGCRWDERALAAAAESGNFLALAWLVKNGCPVQPWGRHYLAAARKGDLATLRYLRRLGCPWDPHGRTFSSALSLNCHQRVLSWLVDEGCPVNWVSAMAAARRRFSDAAEVSEWLLQEQYLQLVLQEQQQPSPSPQGEGSKAQIDEQEDQHLIQEQGVAQVEPPLGWCGPGPGSAQVWPQSGPAGSERDAEQLEPWMARLWENQGLLPVSV
ncbi:hypothetical protein GPECTOR_53g148 [Gonium pectorale]|uniref:Uncharacterized protein n=1 Tax=Gonium pectorale TaxID=33097 RepID=A0A150G6U1_GONPE|nr:hypothetical protein GPECTOR_53g148 [Gonium pectorale]|eukprot:KXZ45562.1 hypothetical protein GPECTOR_53g148 [Gonium pectorale]